MKKKTGRRLVSPDPFNKVETFLKIVRMIIIWVYFSQNLHNLQNLLLVKSACQPARRRAASRRHCEEERRSNPDIKFVAWIASFLAMTQSVSLVLRRGEAAGWRASN